MTDKTIQVNCGGGAYIRFPFQGNADEHSYAHNIRYGVTDKSDGGVAASCLDSYAYLVLSCTKEEAWRRIKLIRAALS